MKTEVFHLRVSEEEKENLKKLAATHGCSVSTYVRNASLQSLPQIDQQKHTQQIFAQLCEIANLIQQIEDPILRDKFRNWRENTWQYIK